MLRHLRLLVSIVILVAPSFIAGQNISRFVFSTGGGSLVSEEIAFTSTIGQAGLAGNLSGEEISLHIGFQQMVLPASTASITSGDRQIMVYPNPFNNSFTVQVHTKNDQWMSYHLVDIHGRILFHLHSIALNSGDTRIVENDLDTPPGLYFLKINFENNPYDNAQITIPLISL